MREIRAKHPRMGTRKLYELLEPFMLEHHIKMGRDALFDVLAANKLLVRKRKRGIRTTNSSHWLRKWPNLIREIELSASNQLWVSDITYWKSKNENYYISFITDAYSHKIVGYHVGKTLETIESLTALKMALNSLDGAVKLIHHSDRGVQYCSHEYVKQLQDYGIQISMTENGDPLENAIAERVNGIIKDEYLNAYEVDNLNEARELLNYVITLYNEERPHMSIEYKVPEALHSSNQTTLRKWKNYYSKNVSL